jgi:signal transduction histidine kinase
MEIRLMHPAVCHKFMQVCHGLRNPLHALLGMVDESDGAEIDKRALRGELRAMQSVLDAVVDTQQLEAGIAASVHMGPTDLQAVVRDVCQFHRSMLGDAVDLDISLAPNVPIITSDALRIGQVRVARCSNRS